MDKTSLLLSNISFSNHITNVDTKFGKFPRGSPLATQQKLHHDYVLSILDAGDFPDIPVKNMMVNELQVVLDYNAYIQFNSLIILKMRHLKLKRTPVYNMRIPSGTEFGTTG